MFDGGRHEDFPSVILIAKGITLFGRLFLSNLRGEFCRMEAEFWSYPLRSSGDTDTDPDEADSTKVIDLEDKF